MIFRLGIFGVLFVALIAVLIFAYSVLEQPKTQPTAAAAPVTEQVLVAAQQLQGGSLLQPTDLTGAPVLSSSMPPGAEIDTPENRSALIGSMVRISMTQGTPILDSAVIHPGDHGFLAAVLAPGMRAVTVGVILPGDSVDVLLTQNIAGAPDDKSIAAEVVLSDVRVIATGAELVKNDSTNTTGGPPATVTLEVTPDQASRCLVATNLGKLSLIVHSAQLAAGPAVANVIPQPVWSGEVSPALANTHPASPSVSTVKVFQGSPSEQDYNF